MKNILFIPEKTYTENPFMDNVIYYSKVLGCNATIKDEREALFYETKESLERADIYIACIENRATYGMFDEIPISILENYIKATTNLDIYIKDPQWLKNHMDSYPLSKRTKMLNNLSELARTTYIDHYNIMVNYIKELGGTWLEDNYNLYQKCKDGSATYSDLFDILPLKTNLRIIRTYLNSHGYIDLAILWDPDSELTKDDLQQIENAAKENNISVDAYYNDSVRNLLLDIDYVINSTGYNTSNSNEMNQFIAYINTRSDSDVLMTELNNISKAMRDVFISHYEIMKEREYLSKAVLDNIDLETGEALWLGYRYDRNIYNKCKNDNIHWYELWNYLPMYAIRDALNYAFGEDDVNNYGLYINTQAVQEYLSSVVDSSTSKSIALTQYMVNDYIANYQIYLNRSIYDECIAKTIDIYDMYEYLPKETLKSILNTEIELTSNLDAYSKSKTIRDSYLESIDTEEAKRIKNAITADMMLWYPNNYVELNNYYRAFAGLPPLGSNGEPYEDTLEHTWLPESNEFLEFGSNYVNQCPTDIYNKSHWQNQLYTYDNYDVNILNDNGIIDSYVSTERPNGCGSNINSMRYRYLKYLGDNKLSVYECRKASDFDLLNIPSVDDSDIRNKFIDLYNINREYVIRDVYDDAYNFQSDYYTKFMITFTLINTILDLCTSIPDYIITKTVFDYRCIKYLFQSVGIPYYDEIPLKYQQAMLRNLNLLIKYKSSTRNMIDICNLFGFNDIKIYEYYMIKIRHKDDEDNFVPVENNEITYNDDNLYIKYKYGDTVDVSGQHFSKLHNYPYFQEDYYFNTISVLNDDGSITEKKVVNNSRDDLYVYDKFLQEMIPLKDSSYFTTIKANTKPASLKFIRVPINEQLNEYKEDEDYEEEYDEITEEITWDGGLDHELIRNDIIDYPFNAVKTKYISIDSVSDLTEIAFQTSYFYSMLLDNLYAEDLLRINIDFLKVGHSFKLTDVIFFMFAMMYYYMGLQDNIVYNPTQILFIKGYAFNEVLQKILNNEEYFAQTDSYNQPLDDMKKYSVFNINDQINKKKYNYQELFDRCGLNIKGFNLNANIDALEKWLQTEWRMSLSDFIVSEDTEEFGQVVTLLQFYSLKNSYYQKDIFSGDMLPLQYNQIIKYAYNYYIANKISITDISNINHYYIQEEYSTENDLKKYGYILDIVALVSKTYATYTYDELLDKVKRLRSYNLLSDYAYILKDIFSIDDDTLLSNIDVYTMYKYYDLIINNDNYTDIYIFNNDKYAGRYLNTNDPESIALYNRYIRNNDGSYSLYTKQYYIYNDNTNSYNLLISGFIYVRNSDGLFTLAIDNVFKSDILGNMNEIDYDRYTVYDEEINARVLNYGDYYIQREDGTYVLNPDNCYIYGIVDGIEGYYLLKDIEDYVIKYADTNECYIRNEYGHFVQFLYTDFFIRTHNDYSSGNEMIYSPQKLYVKVDYETNIYDEDYPNVYYKELEDYYKDNMFLVSLDTLYVKDSYGNYIKEADLLVPTNTYFYDNIDNTYHLIKDSQFDYLEYDNKLNVLYTLIKQPNLDYIKYVYEANTENYIPIEDNTIRYIHNSDTNYITILYPDKTYEDTNKVIIVMNEEYLEDTAVTLTDAEKYNPSLNDNVWDENDWYYSGSGIDPDNKFGMNGENKWYYVKEGEVSPEDSSDLGGISTSSGRDQSSYISSGFYFNSESFIGVLELFKDEEYYIGFDLETNFSGTLQIYCTYDDNTNRLYNVTAYESTHVNQTFVSNHTGTPQIIIIKSSFNNNPINKGDYVIISNMRVTRSNSDHYIPVDIPSIDQLTKIYKTNKAIYNWLLTQLHNTHSKTMYDIYKKLYDSLMISNYNKEIFKLPNDKYALTYTDFLYYRDSILYDALISLKNMDSTLMKAQISNYIIDLVYILNNYIGTNTDLQYIYSYFPGVSVNFVQQYLIKIINWFKSWKVQMLGVNTVYHLGGIYYIIILIKRKLDIILKIHLLKMN